MAAQRTSFAHTTGAFRASVGGLRPAHAPLAQLARAAFVPAAGALSLSLRLPIGCRA